MNDTPLFPLHPFYIYLSFIQEDGFLIHRTWYIREDIARDISTHRLGCTVFIILIGPIRPARTITSPLSFPCGGIRSKVSHVACSPAKESAASFERRGRGDFCHQIDAIYHDVSATRCVLYVRLSSLILGSS